MKKCPNGHEVNDNLKYCPKCGAKLNENGIKFCKKCGTERKGAELFCSKCGIPFDGIPMTHPTSSSYDEAEISTDYKKIIIPIVIGLMALAIIGGGWYGYNAYKTYNEAKLAREKFVKDSIETAKNDSIRLAKAKEKERIEAKRLADFHKQLSFDNFLNMLKNNDNAKYAEKCGFKLIYNEKDSGEEVDCYEIVYGWDVEKGKKTGDLSYEIIAKSDHACYYKHVLFSSQYADLFFVNKNDADEFFNKALKYGLLLCEGTYFVPKKKLDGGKTMYIESYKSLEWEGDNSPLYVIGKPEHVNGWYQIGIGIDF